MRRGRAGFALLVLLIGSDLHAQRPEPSGREAEGPSLVVLIAVDQLRPDYVDRFARDLAGGLHAFATRGIWFPRGLQDHAITQTAPGHASMLSGRPPASTGIVANEFGVPDPASPLLGAPRATGASPWRFRGTTLRDWMLAADSGSRVLSVARKDRSAILTAGRARGDVYWYGYHGAFTTSRWYADALPPWLEDWNARRGVMKLAGHAWRPLLPAGRYPAPDSVPFENRGRDVTFPHRLPADSAALVSAVIASPWLDSLTLDLALEGAQRLGLGTRGSPDLLIVGLSTMDEVGHDWGPDSREMHDQVLRLDRWLGTFMDSLARLVPRESTIYALTADHGASPIPEYERTYRQRDAWPWWDRVAPRILRRLEERWRTSFQVTSLYGLVSADVRSIAARGVDVDSLRQVLVDSLMAERAVARVFTPSTLAAADSADPYARLWRRQLSADHQWLVAAVLEPDWIWSGSGMSNHGSPEWHDRAVPIGFLVPGRRPARHDRLVPVTAIGPTLAALLGIAPTEPVAAPLPEVTTP